MVYGIYGYVTKFVAVSMKMRQDGDWKMEESCKGVSNCIMNLLFFVATPLMDSYSCNLLFQNFLLILISVSSPLKCPHYFVTWRLELNCFFIQSLDYFRCLKVLSLTQLLLL